MPSSYTHLIYHVVFGTQARRPLIERLWGDELYRYIGGIIMGQRGALHEIGGTADHVHILAGFKAEPPVATMLRMIKTSSSKWINRRKFLGERFSWQEGYAAFSVSPSQLPRVRRYIRNQDQVHRRCTFDAELDLLLLRHEVSPVGPGHSKPASSHTRLSYHIVFGTKYRQPVIQPPWRDELYRTIDSIIERQRGVLHEINGVADHLHLLADFRAEPSVATMLRLIKTNSSKWVNEQEFLSERFSWQKGYAAFTVSFSQMDQVRRYIQNQEQHHRRYTLDAELDQLVKRHKLSPPQPRRGQIG